jgi:predicted transcriptional regulator
VPWWSNALESERLERKRPQRRTKTEIIFLMLKASSTGITKTSLMEQLKQNHLGTTNYLNELVEKGLIEMGTSNPRSSVCKITKKGEEPLRILEKMEMSFGALYTTRNRDSH